MIITRRRLITGSAALTAYAALERPARATTWAFVAGDSAGAASNPTTASINMTGADFIIIVGSYVNSVTVTPHDSSGNSYGTTDAIQANPSAFKTGMWFVQAPTVTGAMTFGLTGASIFGSLVALGFSGSAASPLDQHTFNNDSFSGSTILPGSITPGFANELVVTGYGANDANGGTYTINSGYTIPTNGSTPKTANFYGSALAYLIQTSATATNPTWTDSAAITGVTAFIASFKVGGAGGVSAKANFFGGTFP